MKWIRVLLPVSVVSFALLLGLVITPQTIDAQQFGSGWVGQYFSNPDFAGDPVFTRVDAQVNFNFGAASPVPGFVPEDNFSIRWTNLEDFAAGTYRFTAGAQDGVQVRIDNQVIIDNLGNNGSFQLRQADVFVAGGTREIVVNFVARAGNAAVQVYWEPVSVGPTATEGPSPTPTATGLPPIPPGSITATVIRASVLNVRDAPSLGGNRITRILRGQTYAVVGRNENATWFLLQLSGRTGWAWGYYLFIDGNEFNPPIVSASSVYNFPGGVQDVGVMAVARADMRMREGPNIQTRQTGRIPWGSFVPIVGRTSYGDWYQVVWKGTVGWVYSPYLDIRFGDLANVPIR